MRITSETTMANTGRWMKNRLMARRPGPGRFSRRPGPAQPGHDQLDGGVEHRDDEHAQHGGAGHAGEHRRPHGAPGGGAGPLGQQQGHHPQDEGERGHEDGPEAQARALQGGVAHRQAGLALVLGELDDEDGVLGRQAHEHDDADLGVDVVDGLAAGEEAQGQPQEGPEDAQGQAQQHAEGDGPALVLGGQEQEHEQQAHAQDERLGAARGLLLEAVPVQSKA